MFIVWRGVRPSMARSQTLRVRKSRERMWRPSREKRMSQTEEMISEKKDLEVGSSSASNSKNVSYVIVKGDVGWDVLRGGRRGRIRACRRV